MKWGVEIKNEVGGSETEVEGSETEVEIFSSRSARDIFYALRAFFMLTFSCITRIFKRVAFFFSQKCEDTTFLEQFINIFDNVNATSNGAGV